MTQDADDWLERGDAESGRRGEVVNKTTLLKLFGLNHTGADRLLKEGLPYLSNGSSNREGWRFDTVAVFEWLKRRAVALATGSDEATALEAARLRNIDIRARTAELEFSRLAVETITRADAIVTYEEQVTAFRRGLARIPDRVLDLTATQRAELQDALDLALGEFAGLPKPGEDDPRVAIN